MSNMSSLLEGLNEGQIAVVKHHTGPALVKATAGSGKTRALVHRIAYLVKERGVDPERILGVTFTRLAAEEMRDRLENLGVSGVPLQTWHSWCHAVLRSTPYFNTYTLDTTNRSRIVLKEILGWKGMKWGNADVSKVESFIGLCKARNLKPKDNKTVVFAVKNRDLRYQQAYELFENARRERGIATFDDLLCDVVDNFDNDEERRFWADRYDFVLQDEAQDENPIQGLLGDALTREHRNYMLIGDIAQSIYGFRGSSPARFREFEKGASVYTLDTNYRSDVSIIVSANRVLGEMKDTDMVMVGASDSPGRVDTGRYADSNEEAESIVQDIASSYADGVSYGKNAILLRVNSQARAIEEALIRNKIPYELRCGVSFYQRKEIKDLLAYLYLACDMAETDDLRRAVNTPFRFLGKAFVTELIDSVSVNSRVVEKLRKYADRGPGNRRQAKAFENFVSVLEMVKSMISKACSPVEIIKSLVKSTGYYDYLIHSEGGESTENNRIFNVGEMITSASRFASIEDFLNHVETIRHGKNDTEKGERVVVSTIHRAKGLEWDNVYMAGMVQDLFPHKFALPEEEMRLFYVGVTRAKKALTLTSFERVVQNSEDRIRDCSEYVDIATGG